MRSIYIFSAVAAALALWSGWWPLTALPLASFLISRLGCVIYQHRSQAYDHPSDRSSHHIPTPTGAGIVIFVVFWALFPLWRKITALTCGGATPEVSILLMRFFAASVILAVVGYIDDRRQVSPRLRLAVHIVCAFIIAWPDGGSQGFASPGFLWGWFLTAALINAFNFLDGVNGLLGINTILALTGASAYLRHFHPESLELTLIFLLLATATGGFLTLNFPRGKIFLGDTGSTFLGLAYAVLVNYTLRNVPSVGSISLPGLPDTVIAVLAPMAFLGFDVIWTLGSRLAQGRPLAQPHRDYLFHRLLSRGLTHGTVTLLYAAATLMATLLMGLWVFGGLSIYILLPVYVLLQGLWLRYCLAGGRQPDTIV